MVTPNRSRWCWEPCPNWKNGSIQSSVWMVLEAWDCGASPRPTAWTWCLPPSANRGGTIMPPRRTTEVQLLIFRALWNPKQSSVSVGCVCYSVSVTGFHEEQRLWAMCLVTAWSWHVRGYGGENKQKHPETWAWKHGCTKTCHLFPLPSESPGFLDEHHLSVHLF